MFIATVKATNLRDNFKENLEMVTDENVLQIMHKNGPIRVLMTQQHYLDLVSRLASYESLADKARAIKAPSAEEIARTLKAKHEKFLAEEEEL